MDMILLGMVEATSGMIKVMTMSLVMIALIHGENQVGALHKMIMAGINQLKEDLVIWVEDRINGI